ncbi:hypothetical protein E3T46_14390 [Cryobacterium sp. Hh11]|uniref:hypothetical protein n=1 Tax=Cryobacterium sp. Hh11 TaxID=2555868 RepID=UPI00106BBCA9|nr:hypothetical protein [Cryobacterium sp. Hh11]TFD48627.1 hypothetical protein E3T46_14390 [Cryobacterium sp. Hh11]
MPQSIRAGSGTRAALFAPLDGAGRAELARQLGVVTVTAREAREILRRNKLVYTKRGRDGGSFVTFAGRAEPGGVCAAGRRHVTGPYVDYLCTDEYTLTLTLPVYRGGTELIAVVGRPVGGSGRARTRATHGLRRCAGDAHQRQRTGRRLDRRPPCDRGAAAPAGADRPPARSGVVTGSTGRWGTHAFRSCGQTGLAVVVGPAAGQPIDAPNTHPSR